MLENSTLYPEYRHFRRQLAQLEAQGVANPFFRIYEDLRSSRAMIEGRERICYSSYNYLGLSGHPSVSAAAKDAIDQFGTSVSASRGVSGERPFHRQLEKELAGLLGVESCLVLVSGHATNVTTIGHLFGPGDLILHDSLIHNSVLEGCSLSGASRLVFRHNDWRALDRKLSRHRGSHRRSLIVTEGVFSMEGDIPDLPRLIEVKKRHDALLMVDEAHSIGVLGRHGGGLGEHFAVDRQDVDIWMGTLSKTFASCGGYIAGGKELVDYLKYTVPGFLYSVGLSPPDAAAALAAVELLKAEPERVQRLRSRVQIFLEAAGRHGIDTGQSLVSSVIPVIVGDSAQCIRLADRLFRLGIDVPPMVYPATPTDGARLRFFLTVHHSAEQIQWTVETLAAEMSRLRAEIAENVAP